MGTIEVIRVIFFVTKREGGFELWLVLYASFLVIRGDKMREDSNGLRAPTCREIREGAMV